MGELSRIKTSNLPYNTTTTALSSDTNPIPRSANRKKAESLGALKISTESDDYIFDEIHRRDRLEDEEFEDEMEEEEDEGELEDE